jgi:pilus assembly protein FimV
MAVETSEEDDRQYEQGFSATNTATRGKTDPDDIEQYGVWVKAGPVDIGDEEDSGSEFEIDDLQSESENLTEEEEELLGSLENDENAAVEEEPAVEEFNMDDLPGLGDEGLAVPSGEEFDLPSETGYAGTENMHGPDQEEEEALDDIGGFEVDLTDSNQKDVSMGIPEESASILQKIERDLLSIKEELTALKNEIYSLRSGGAKAETEEARAEAEPGFFEEDEDETIALTGDELDNILNTADITEQTGESTASPEDSDLLVEEEDAGTQSIIDREDVLLAEEEEPTVEAPTVEEPVVEAPEISLGEEMDELTIDESLADTASVSGETPEELSVEEPESVDAVEELLELPEEEELQLEELTRDVAPEGQESGEGPEEIELDLEEVTSGEDTTFELDEELGLSSSENEELVSPPDLGGDDLSDLGETEFDASELAEMESEAHEAAPEVADVEEAVEEEAFDLSEEEIELPEPATVESEPAPALGGSTNGGLPEDLKSEIRTILRYMDQLLESLPEEKIEEFANSEYFDVYKRLFEELGLTS